MRISHWLSCLLAIAGMGTAEAAITLSGTVKDTSGKALDSIRVSLQAPGKSSFARDTTGPTGAFAITSDSTTGKYVLRTTSMGSTSYTTRNDTIVLSGKDTAGIVLTMVPVPAPVKSTVSGKVDSAGSAKVLAGAIVTLRANGAGGGAGATTLRDTTGADGTYAFADVTTGIYTLSVSATGYTSKSVTDTVTAAPDTVNVSLAAIVTSSVSGKVDSAGSAKALAGAIVTLRANGAGGGAGATTLRDTTGADGTYAFANVAAGIYTLSVSATGYTSKSVIDTITATPDTVNVSLAATIPARTIVISGTVKDTTGKALDSVYVSLRSVGAGASTLLRDTTGADGAFSLTSTYLTGKYVLRLINLKRTADTLSDTVTLDSANLSVALVWKKKVSASLRDGLAGLRTSFAKGILAIGPVTSEGSVRLFQANGALLARRTLQPAARVVVPLGGNLSRGTYLLEITQAEGVVQKWVVVP